jgi:hypothetical protein
VSPRFPGYDVLDKWESVSFDTLTRGVLRQRLGSPPQRRFFTEAEFATLEAAAARLAPTPEQGPQPPIAAWIDAELYEGRDEGWRQEGRPPIPAGWRLGLRLLAEEAQAQYGRAFVEQDEATQVAFLARVQGGEVDEARWAEFDAKAFFGDVLKSVVGIYYAHPQGWNEIGFGGPASPRGYVRLGLNEHDPWEAREAGQDRTQGSGG